MQLRDKELDLSTPQIMGILNITPDSFSDGGRHNAVSGALRHVDRMIRQGAAIIDIGGESTRPGSDAVSKEEELARVLPVIEQVVERFPDTFFSVDTTKYEVAKEALERGVHIINDISGLQQEPRLASLCAQYQAGFVLMHSQGNPKIMQDDPSYVDVVEDIIRFFHRQLAVAAERGLERIILDPGIGFGKDLEHNITIFKQLDRFTKLGYPLLVGASRKSMIGQLLKNRPVDDRLSGTLVVHYNALMQGANIIRVHDVKDANDSILVYNALAGC